MALSLNMCRRAALCRADQLESKHVPVVRRGEPRPVRRRSRAAVGAACAVVHSLRVGVHTTMVLVQPPTLAGVPVDHRRSDAVIRLRAPWNRFNAARVD